MLSVSNTLKTAALAAALSLGGIAAGPASADTYTTRCFGDDCYRVRCDDFGADCVRTSYYDYDHYVAPVAPRQTRMVCDEYGDNCHYVSVPGYYDDQGIWHPDF